MIRASNEVAIIGGGLAGLSCAIALEDRGINYKLFEASDRLGGRVHTYQRKKLTVDRGFQILLPNYQICKKLLDYKALDLCYYPNGANLLTIDGPEWFGKPFSYPKKFQHGRKLTPHLSDYICLAKDVFLGFKRPTKIALENQTYLQNFYSKEFQEKFLLPFFRGIFLNLDWNQNFHRFRYYLKCFFLEGGAVPKKGMQEIPNQLASKLNPKNIELNTRITQIKDNTIYIKNQPHRFDQIVMATDMSSYYKLMNQPEPENGWNQEYNYIFASKEPTKLAPLNLVSRPSIISHFNLPTLVSNEIAPKEMHFMNISTFKKYTPTEIEIEIRQLTQEHGWFFAWEDHIPKATPKIQNLPKLNNDHIDICGDWTNAGSIEGAMLSGHNAGKRLAKKRT